MSTKPDRNLFLALALLGLNNSESRHSSHGILLDGSSLGAVATLLGHLGPATVARRRHGASVGVLLDNALVGELATTDKLLGKVTAVHRGREAVDALGKDGDVKRELEEGGSKGLDCEKHC